MANNRVYEQCGFVHTFNLITKFIRHITYTLCYMYVKFTDMNKGKSKKMHLIYGILTTKCGKQLEEVEYTIDVNLCTCKTCLKQKHTNYPRR